MMGYWLQNSGVEHGGECCKPFGLDPTHLGHPKWLIDVQKICLVVAEPDNRYACLSYVWGNVPTLKTERVNLNSLMEENSLESKFHGQSKKLLVFVPSMVSHIVGLMPFAVSRMTEIPYMIRSRAWLEYVPTPTCHTHCWQWVVANHGLRGIQGATEPWHLPSSLKYGLEEDVPPYSDIWYSRDWTFQEMTFSPRKIMFQYQLAVWECNSTTCHEYSLTGTPSPDGISGPSINPWKSRIHLTEWPDVKQYIAIVDNYTETKFTYAEHSLHAIVTLLSVLSSSFRGTFIGGLPEMFYNGALL
jgi:hypothetical protein